MAERFMGAACLLMGASGITVEVQSPHKWIKHDGGDISISLGCIGGGIEEGETPIEALHRESLEEMGCPVVIQSASQTIEMPADGHPRTCSWSYGLPRPILIWDAKAAGINADGRGVVYMGTADGTPQPCDLGGLLTLPLGQVLTIGDRPQSVAAVIMEGATLQERVGIPTTAILSLGATLAVLHRLYRQHRSIADAIIAEIRPMGVI